MALTGFQVATRTQKPTRWRVHARRGLTLIELMIVIGLLLAMAGVVTPMVFSRLESSVFDETVRQVGSALALCRTDARLAGQPVRLVAVTSADGSVVLVGLAVVGEGSAMQSPRRASDSVPRTSPRDEDNNRESDALPGPAGRDPADLGRRYMTLPRGYRITREPIDDQLTEALARSATIAEAFVPVPEPGGEAFDAGLDTNPPVTIAVFLPDGSALTGDPVRLVAPSGVSLIILIGAWSGRATLEVVEKRDTLTPDDPMQDLLPETAEPDPRGHPEPGS